MELTQPQRHRKIAARFAASCAVVAWCLLAVVAPGRGAEAQAQMPAARWQVVGTPTQARITGGPWTLGQGPATATDPAVGYPTPNPGTQLFQPYYFPVTYGDDRVIEGLFDYRPRSIEEAIVSAHSDDGGRSWMYTGEALRYTPNATVDLVNGNDDGQGHPYMLQLGNVQYMYTLDRTAGRKNSVGLIVHRFGDGHPLGLGDLPANETPPGQDVLTTGLLNPDGILAVVPGASPLTVLYLQKVLGKTAVEDVTTVRIARTEDGIRFTDLGAATGLLDDTTRFVGPRGTVIRIGDGADARYGLFYSGGTLADADSDAFHYIGYAESKDLLTWTVVNGVKNPLLSRDTTDASGAPQPWFAGRVYSPSVTFSADGSTATLVFAGYRTPKPKDNLGDYRSIGVVTIRRVG